MDDEFDPLRFPRDLAIALAAIRRFAALRHGVFLDRPINRRSAKSFPLSAEEAWRRLAALGLEDFHDGPAMDHYHGDRIVWIFGPTIEKTQFYVKVSLPPSGDPLGTGLLIWSFHVARFSMRLPYA